MVIDFSEGKLLYSPLTLLTQRTTFLVSGWIREIRRRGESKFRHEPISVILVALIAVAPFLSWLDIERHLMAITFFGDMPPIFYTLWDLSIGHVGVGIKVSNLLSEASLITGILLLFAAAVGLKSFKIAILLASLGGVLFLASSYSALGTGEYTTLLPNGSPITISFSVSLGLGFYTLLLAIGIGTVSWINGIRHGRGQGYSNPQGQY